VQLFVLYVYTFLYFIQVNVFLVPANPCYLGYATIKQLDVFCRLQGYQRFCDKQRNSGKYGLQSINISVSPIHRHMMQKSQKT